MKTTLTIVLVHGLCISTWMLVSLPSRATELTLNQAKTGAEKGDAEAEFSLGKAYYYGTGVPKDFARAFELYQKSAEQGDFKAENNLAVMYRLGQGVRKDPAAAAGWFRKAAAQGAALAQYSLATMLDAGEGIPMDAQEALVWCRKAALRGYAPAQSKLGQFYERGVPGLSPDRKQAIVWYRKAAEQGDAQGEADLGRLYCVGADIEKDPVIGFKWLILSNKQGNMEAKVLINEMKQTITKDQFDMANRLAADFQAKKSAVGPQS
jgi:TPR repeat protein